MLQEVAWQLDDEFENKYTNIESPKNEEPQEEKLELENNGIFLTTPKETNSNIKNYVLILEAYNKNFQNFINLNLPSLNKKLFSIFKLSF